MANFKTLGVDASFISTTSDAASGVAQITVDASGQNEIVIVAGANGLLSSEDVDAAAPAFERSSVLLTQLEVPLPTTIAALRAGRKAGLMTVFNSAPAPTEPLPDELYPLCDIICPNETETALLTGMPTNTLKECEAAARAIIAKGAKQVVMTLGGRGCMLLTSANAPAVYVPVPDDMKGIQVADTTGAGDGFLGAFAHLVAHGLPLQEALKGAVRVASISVQRRGAQSSYPTAKELPQAWRDTVDAYAPKEVPPPLPKVTAASRAASLPATFKGTSKMKLKQDAAFEAVDTYVMSGMLVGIGTGDTAGFAIERLAERLKQGVLERVRAVPTSAKTEAKLREAGIPTVSFETQMPIDVAITSADSVDAYGNVIKGGKGALLREKLVQAQASKYIVAVDQPKMSGKFGFSYPIPVEIAPFYAQRTLRAICTLPSLGQCDAQLRYGDHPAGMPGVGAAKPFVTDNGNFIVDIFCTAPLVDVPKAAAELKATTGVVDHGLFVMSPASVTLVGADEGVTTVVAPKARVLHTPKATWLLVGLGVAASVALVRSR